jgi:hypothetical protein
MGAKKILYKNHCTPQEQITDGGRYYLDSDCGRKLTGSHMKVLGAWDTESDDYDDDTDNWEAIRGATTTGILTTIGKNTLGSSDGFDFISVKLVSGDDVNISFNNSVHGVVQLKAGECFASSILAESQPRVNITGTSIVEYMTGT